MTAALAATVCIAFSPLEEEGLQFLQRLSSMGYEAVAMRTLELRMLDPCTLQIYAPGNTGGGFLVGMGGRDVLDLRLRVEGDGWALEDTLPDDLPVIELDARQARTIRRVILTVMDMLRSTPSDSVLFMYALAPVDPGAAADDFR